MKLKIEDQLPSSVKEAMQSLEKEGYPTYLVGGAIRDLVMGKKPHDYDLTTLASFEQISSAFSKK